MMKNQNFVDLIQGIEDLLSGNRCPLTDDEKVLLKNCLKELKSIDEKSDNLLKTMEKVVKWLLLFFEVYNNLKDIF